MRGPDKIHFLVSLRHELPEAYADFMANKDAIDFLNKSSTAEEMVRGLGEFAEFPRRERLGFTIRIRPFFPAKTTRRSS